MTAREKADITARKLVYTLVLGAGRAVEDECPGMNDYMYLRIVELVLRKAHEIAGAALSDYELKQPKTEAN